MQWKQRNISLSRTVRILWRVVAKSRKSGNFWTTANAVIQYSAFLFIILQLHITINLCFCSNLHRVHKYLDLTVKRS